MNYLYHYKNLINKRRKNTPEGYTERHHIVPKSCGGSNSEYNIVRLTAREHFIAHRLLVKLCVQNYGKSHKYTKSMKYALYNFTSRKAHKNANYKITSKTYEKLKVERSKFLSKQLKADYASGKRVAYWKGKNGPMKGKKHSPESRRKMSLSAKGATGRTIKKETIENLREINTGEGNPMFGKTFTMSDERKSKIGNANAKYSYTVTYTNNTQETINNLNKFCRENNYSLGCVAMVLSGKRKRHKNIIKIKKHDK